MSQSSRQTPVEHALYDGEDFELLLSISPGQFESLVKDSSFEFQLFEIGHCTAEHGGEIIDARTRQPIAVRGYEH